MSKPISLNSLTFSDTKGNPIIVKDYFTTFHGEDADVHLENFIQDEYLYMQLVLKRTPENLKLAQDSGETLDELEVRKTVRLIAKYRGVDYKGVTSRSRKTEYIEVRRMAIALCVERNTRITTIAKAMKLHHANVIHHRDTFKNLCETEQKYKDEFEEASDYVATFMKL